MSQQTKSLAELLRDAASSLEFEVESAKLHFTGEMLAIMEERGISRSELAARLGVKPARITALLRGDNNFTLETMIRICRALGVKYSHHLAEAGCDTLWIDIPADEVALDESFVSEGHSSEPGKIVAFPCIDLDDAEELSLTKVS